MCIVFRNNVATPTLEVALLFDKAVRYTHFNVHSILLHGWCWLSKCSNHAFANPMFISIIWLPMFVSMRQDNAPQQCIQYQTILCFFDAPRIFQSSELVPWKQWHMQFGGARKTVYLCANRLHLSVLMNKIWSGWLVHQQILILFVKKLLCTDCFNVKQSQLFPIDTEANHFEHTHISEDCTFLQHRTSDWVL